MTMWNPTIVERGPVYLAITRALEADVRAGRLRPGDQLPTHRHLASELGVNVGTISRSYAEARRRGLIHGEVGRGTFVSRPRPAALSLIPSHDANREQVLVDLSINLPLTSPAPDIADGLRRLADRPDLDTALGYQDPAGSRAVRAAGARWFERLGMSVRAEQVVVCSGAQHAILVSLASVVGPGELVLCEALTYPGFMGAAKMLGLRVKPVEIDREGIVLESLEAICRAERPRLLYCMPTLQNPTTAMLSEERRIQIARIAREYDLVIVQDDVQGGLIDDPAHSIETMAPERVLTIGGISKNLAPGLRVAFLAGSEDRISRQSDLIWSSVWMAPPIGAELAAMWIDDGTADKIQRARRAEMEIRHEVARVALDGLRFHTVAGAYHVWLELEFGWTGATYSAALQRKGVAVTAADAFAVNGEPTPAAVRISLSSTKDLGALRNGLETVASLARTEPTPIGVRL